jgi:hypothetical protein
MGAVVLEPPEKVWECPSCGFRDRTREARPHTRMHACRAMAGLTAPMVEVRSISGELDHRKVRLVRVEREDYVGRAVVRTDGEGRPAMAVRTERADGSNDAHVFADTAVFRLSEHPHLVERVKQDPELAGRLRARFGLEVR